VDLQRTARQRRGTKLVARPTFLNQFFWPKSVGFVYFWDMRIFKIIFWVVWRVVLPDDGYPDPGHAPVFSYFYP
jgi:hypothetical protein